MFASTIAPRGISQYQHIALLVVKRTLTKTEAIQQLRAAGYTTREETRRLIRYIAAMQQEQHLMRSMMY